MSNNHVTIVATLYNSAPFIEEFYGRCKRTVEAYTENFDFIFVNDGSPDNSKEIVLGIIANDKKVALIDLSKNFGHHRAIMCGLEKAKGDFIFLTDIDLEEPPEDFSKYWKSLLSNADTDVVYGFQNHRKGKFFERISGWIFYSIINHLSDVSIKRNLVTSRLMTRRYVKNLLLFRESEMMLAGLFELVGFKQIGIPVIKSDKGSTTYTLRKKLSLMINAITSLSNRPLYYVFYLGISVVLTSIIVVIYLVIRRLLDGAIFSGWTSLMVSIWFLSGAILTSAGIISIYLSKIFYESKHRPRYIIRESYNPHD